MEVEACRRCHESPGREELVELWDRNTYCRRCIQSRAPALLDFLCAHDELREEMPWDWREELLEQALLCAAVGSCFACFVVVYAALAGETESLGGFLLVSVLLLLAVWLIQALTSFWYSKATRCAVEVKDGLVRANRPWWKGRKDFAIPLAELSWYEGRVKNDTLYNGIQKRNEPAVVLVYSVRWRGWRITSHRIACGFTPEMRDVWRSFLRLIDLPKDRK